MPRGITKRRPRTVGALLDAAFDLFAEQGFGGTSIPEICARAGLTKGAFYSNFANKDALFLALLDRSWERRAARIRQALPPPDGDVASDPVLRRRVGGAMVDRQWTLVSMEFSLHAIRHPEVAALLAEHEQRVRAELAALVAEAFDHRGRRPVGPVDELARMIVAVTEGNDVQVLTDTAAGVASPADRGSRAVSALLEHFSEPLDVSAGSPHDRGD